MSVLDTLICDLKFQPWSYS